MTADRFNEKRLNQARTGLFIEHAGDCERVGIFILESPRDLGRLNEMAPVRIPQYSTNSSVGSGIRVHNLFPYSPLIWRPVCQAVVLNRGVKPSHLVNRVAY